MFSSKFFTVINIYIYIYTYTGIYNKMINCIILKATHCNTKDILKENFKTRNQKLCLSEDKS